ncbi:hypothetical protein BV898_11553 [Hypsibius exemplaris]|uniref:Uncharacterized protein n=1 Tax=Hypsibius exemplaris TaxID=2072580 RepID=A0A1W0WG71_HYPEX|nr:hypothetical protein BV898_11553 [Hypsibius exemplaris]
MKLFYDCNELYVDSEDEGVKGWVPFAQRKVIKDQKEQPCVENNNNVDELSQRPGQEEGVDPDVIVYQDAENGVRSVLLTTSPSAGLELDACDCGRPEYAGVMSFDCHVSCVKQPATLRYRQVKYELIMEDAEGKKCHDHFCRVWEREKQVKKSIILQTDTTYRANHKQTSPAECWAMVQSSTCGDATMKKIGHVWSYKAEPEGEGTWNSVMSFRTLNCEVMEVMLEEGCAGCPIHSATNELAENRKVGYSIQSQRTFVWSAVVAQQKPCDLKRMMVRSGCFYNDSGVLRLRDTDKQMDFVLRARRKTCLNDGVEVFSVKRVNHMSIRILDWPSARRWCRQLPRLQTPQPELLLRPSFVWGLQSRPRTTLKRWFAFIRTVTYGPLHQVNIKPTTEGGTDSPGVRV